ncbi:uncharacterized protein [Diadema antillarum]|uniref:uncharacterized protein n=1 Tax=Diadema antillarum TaxID=105358 RepID=UPI003A8A2F3F
MAGVTLIRFKLITASLLSAGASLAALRCACNGENGIVLRILTGLMSVPAVLLAFLFTWLSTLRISYGHTLWSVCAQFIYMALLQVTRHGKVKRCEESWANPRQTQEQYLREIIELNQDTAYSMDRGINSVTSLKELRERHPLTTYESYRPYVDRMAKGEEKVLTSDPPTRFALTSGTTGKYKMFPYTKPYFSRIFRYSMALIMEIGVRFLSERSMLQRDMRFHIAPKIRRTEGGTLMGPASMIPNWMKTILALYSSPGAGFDVYDNYDSVYVHLLFGLRDPNLSGMYASFTSTIMFAMRQLERCWPDIVRDIENGTVSAKTISPETRRTLEKALGGGDPERAAHLRREFKKGFDGIVKRVWPHLLSIQAKDSQGLRGILQKSYAKGIPIFGYMLSATEGVVAFNMWPMKEGKEEYVLMPTCTVFEFIPEDHMHEDEPETYFIDELRVGGTYEVVVTQIFGIYRFRYGDVVRVTRFHHNTPVVEFMYRSGQMLNVSSEKLDQATVQQSIEGALKSWSGFQLVEYAVAESSLLQQLDEPEVQSIHVEHRPFYVIFLELDQLPEPGCLAEEDFMKIDEQLRALSFPYHTFRDRDVIAPPRVHVVKPGTFGRLQDYILANSTATANQYKVPRKLVTLNTLKLMLDSRVL